MEQLGMREQLETKESKLWSSCKLKTLKTREHPEMREQLETKDTKLWDTWNLDDEN